MARSPGSVGQWLVIVGLVLSACSAAETTTAVPTQALIPATITDTPAPAPPTATLPVLPGPEDLLATPQADAPILIPAALQPLITQITNDLAARLNVDSDSVQLALVEERTWVNDDLGCSQQNLTHLDQAIDGYRLVLLVGNTPYEYHTNGSSSFRRCGGADTGAQESDVLVQTDPVAAELVALAQRRVSENLNIATQRIRLVEISPVQWTDTSLGCPQRGETYQSMHIDGYRIVLAVGDAEYIFHADFDRVMPCNARDEVIPPQDSD